MLGIKTQETWGAGWYFLLDLILGRVGLHGCKPYTRSKSVMIEDFGACARV